MARYNGQCPSGLCTDNAMGFKLGECYTNEKVGRCSKCTLKQIDDQCNDNAECCSNFCRGSNRPGKSTRVREYKESAKMACIHVRLFIGLVECVCTYTVHSAHSVLFDRITHRCVREESEMSQRWGIGERPYLIVTVRRAKYASSSFLPCFLLHSFLIYPYFLLLTSYSFLLPPSL